MVLQLRCRSGIVCWSRLRRLRRLIRRMALLLRRRRRRRLLLLILILFLIMIHLVMQQRSDVKNNFQAVGFYRSRSGERYFGRKEICAIGSSGLVSAPSELFREFRHLAGIATRFTAKYAGSTLQSLVAEKRSFNFSSSAAFRESGGNTFSMYLLAHGFSKN